MTEARKIVDLAAARVLISNDDGIRAKGLAVLEDAVRPLVKEARIVAPEGGRSGASHMITYAGHVRLKRVGTAERYVTDGSPADAAILGLQKVFSNGLPDLVLSGVNHGLNMGDDFFSSGTMGVAIEACLQNVPAISFSAYRGEIGINWDTVERVLPDVLGKLAAFGWVRDVFYNVNIPNRPYGDIRGMVPVPQGRMDDASSFVVAPGDDPRRSGTYRLRHNGGIGLRQGDCDYTAIRDGYITVTPVRVEITDRGMLDQMKDALT
ncbi:5'/3'-nucleotidase SurE [Hwanghaeella sp.]|uniref:5'/3'-nucleotidase SurE n=1 Tax=Hwanghaeella sp. TaxID=2605943 RepID=UPI003CCC210F